MDLRKEQVRLVRSRFEGGIGNELDVARAETELATTEAEAASLARRRTELENALAILIGQNPSTFHLPATSASLESTAAGIPAGLPSALLERRPDVAEAERQLASANARIGVAKAAFFPVLSLTGSGGYLSGDIETLFNWSSHPCPSAQASRCRSLPAVATRRTTGAAEAAYQEVLAVIGSKFSSPSAKSKTAFRPSVTWRMKPPPNSAR